MKGVGVMEKEKWDFMILGEKALLLGAVRRGAEAPPWGWGGGVGNLKQSFSNKEP